MNTQVEMKSPDDKLTDLLRVMLKDSAENMEYVKALKNKKADRYDKELLDLIYVDAVKEFKYIRELLYLATGKYPDLKLEDMHFNLDQHKKEYEKFFMNIMDGITIFRKIYYSLPMSDEKDIIFELIIDKLKQMSMINLLYQRANG